MNNFYASVECMLDPVLKKYPVAVCGSVEERHGIRTIGDLAKTDPDFLNRRLGKNGIALWQYANGNDRSRVMNADFVSPVKSVGHGITTIEGL